MTTYDWKDAETIAAESVKAWMASEGHRQNMLQKDYTMTGMGIAFSADFKVYVTQVFC